MTAGETDTLVTMGVSTVTVAVPDCPSLVPVIVTGPPETRATTRPVPETVATALFDDDHVTTRPVNVAPDASRSVGTNWTAPPGVSEDEVGAMVTVATGGGVTVTVAEPSWPSLVATIVTGPPTVTAVTSPVLETVATAVLVEDHVTVRFCRLPPAASRGVAVSCVVWPMEIELDAGDTTTDATGAGGLVPPLHAASTVRHATSGRRT
jgi:hypothetical protein